MKVQLANSAKLVQDALDKKGLSCEVIELPSGAHTAQAAADSIGCSVSQILKSIIFKTKETSTPVLVLASGSNRVDEGLIESYVGERISKADAKFVRDVTGYAIGGVPPIGHATAIDFIYIDPDLLSLGELWAGAGTPHAVFCIKSEDLLDLSHGTVTRVTKES